MNSALEKTLPDEWVETTIEDSCEILDKLRKPISQKNRINGEYPYYGATGIVDYINDFIFDERLVLVGEDGAKWERGDKTGFIAEGKYWVNNHAHVLRVNEDVLIDKWLVYFLCVSNLSDYITGTTVPKLNQQKLKSINLPIAPLEEQKRIVAKIDTLFAKIDKAIALTEEILVQAKNLLPSVLNEVFEKGKADGWEEKKLEDVCNVVGGGTPKTKVSEYWNGEIVWLSPVDLPPIGEISIASSSRKKITNIGLEKSSAKLLPKGSVVYSTRASIGKIAIADIPLSTNQGFTNFICSEQINNRYLCFCLKHFNKSIENLSNSTTFKEVSKSAVKEFGIPVPSLASQMKLVKLADSVLLKSKQSQSKLEEQLAYLKQLKSSILSKAFKGEL